MSLIGHAATLCSLPRSSLVSFKETLVKHNTGIGQTPLILQNSHTSRDIFPAFQETPITS